MTTVTARRSADTGRRSGRTFETPVTVARHDDSFLIALPYGERTDWLKNVLDKGSAAIVTKGRTYEVDRPQVIPMAEATAYFRPREQRMHRQFHVDSALQVRQRMKLPDNGSGRMMPSDGARPSHGGGGEEPPQCSPGSA